MSECNICAEKYNKSNRVKVICRCEFEACRACIKKYLLRKVEDIHCMLCKIGWDRKFMTENFEKTFMSKIYRDHRETVLIEKEMGMLEATQPYVEREIRIEKLRELIEINKEEYMRKHIIYMMEMNELNENKSIERKKFIRKCPNGECRGFLSTGLKCEICEIFACGECHEITGRTMEEREAHKCDDQIVESVKAIAKDSKSCPKCGCMTYKIVGCDQMYCVECHTPWDWKSGKIVTGNIHNPHYFEYLAKQNGGQVPRNPLDIICGREIDNNFIANLTREFPNPIEIHWQYDIYRGTWFNRIKRTSMNECPYKPGMTAKDNFMEIARNVIHIRQVELPRFNRIDQLEDNLMMRIAYMRNKIDKEEFKKKIQKKEKENEKKREIFNIISMYINCLTDILYRLIDKPKDKNIIQDEIEELRKYTNELLKETSDIYKSKKYFINEDYIFKC